MEGMGTEMGGWGMEGWALRWGVRARKGWALRWGDVHMEGMGTEEVLCWKQGLAQTRAAAGRGRWHSHGWVSPSFVFS